MNNVMGFCQSSASSGFGHSGGVPHTERKDCNEFYPQENPQLYEVAKKVTLAAGLSWTDPRTGKTYQPKRKQRIPEEKGDCPLCPVCLEESDRILKGLRVALGL